MAEYNTRKEAWHRKKAPASPVKHNGTWFACRIVRLTTLKALETLPMPKVMEDRPSAERECRILRYCGTWFKTTRSTLPTPKAYSEGGRSSTKEFRHPSAAAMASPVTPFCFYLTALPLSERIDDPPRYGREEMRNKTNLYKMKE